MFPQKFFESLEAVLYVALNSSGQPVRCKQICEAQGLLPRHLEQILQSLVKNGILRGSKGPKGGYTLAIEKRKLNVADIYKAINCCDDECSKSQLNKDVITPLKEELSKGIVESLKDITLEELCERAVNSVKKPLKTDFNI